MSETSQLVIEATSRVFSDLSDKETVTAAEQGIWPEKLWSTLAEDGWISLALSEEQGGAGLGLSEVYTFLRTAARYAAPLPLAETVLGRWLLAEAGIDVPDGPLSLILAPRQHQVNLHAESGHWLAEGVATRLPYCEQARYAVVMVAEGEPRSRVGLVELPRVKADDKHRNVAAEYRHTVQFEKVAVSEVSEILDISIDSFFQRYALARAAQITGALDKVLELCLAYANERIQFGRPIGKFQAVQQQLAEMSERVYAAKSAVDYAVHCLNTSHEDIAIAAAKVSASDAAGEVARVAHAVHAAIGFTYEHELHFYTRRLWAWRDEVGSDHYWAERLGRQVVALGADQLWPYLTARPKQ